MPDIQTIFQWLCKSTFQISILILLIVVVRIALRNKLAARWQYWLWLIVLARMLMPALPQSSISLFNLLPDTTAVIQDEPETDSETDTVVVANLPQQSIDDSHSAITNSTTSPDTTAPIVKPKPAPESTIASPVPAVPADPNPLDTTAQTPHQPTQQQASPKINFSQIILSLWALGAVILAFHIMFTNFKLWRRVKSLRQLTDHKILNSLEDCKAQMGIETVIGVVVTDAVKSPALFGFLRPRLLLPSDLISKLSPAQLRHIFFHELAHLKRCDICISWLTALLQIVHWFNPFVWLAFYQMRADREMACDSLALSMMGSGAPSDYGRTIVRLLENYANREYVPAMAGILESKSNLKQRIGMIAKFKQGAYKWSPLAVILMVTICSVGLVDAKRKSPKTPFTKTLKNGIKVQLVGVCEHPGKKDEKDRYKNTTWWSPQGAPLGYQLYDHTSGWVAVDDNHRGYEFTAKITNAPEDINTRIKVIPSGSSFGGGASSPLMDGIQLNDLRYIATSIDKKLQTCTVSVGIASGPWQAVSRSSKTNRGKWTSTFGTGNRGTVAFSIPLETDAKATVTATHEMGKSNVRIVAVDINDKEYIAVRSSSKGSTGFQQLTGTFDVKLDKVKSFIIQERKYNWTKFKNVKLLTEENSQTDKIKQWVEDFFKNNYKDITKRKTIEFADYKQHENGNISITYKYEAVIWNSHKITNNQVFEYDKNGKFVSVRDASAQSHVQAWVEDYLWDTKARRTLEWGKAQHHENGNVSIRYKYEILLREDTDKINKNPILSLVQNKVFTFDNNGKFISVKDVATKKTSSDLTVDPFRKSLNNGVTVEVIGSCQYTDHGINCYRPDGTPLGRNLSISKWNVKPKAGDTGLILKIDMDKDVSLSYTTKYASSSQASCSVLDENGKKIDGYEAILTKFDADKKTTSVKFGAAAGKWNTVAKHDGKSIGIDNGISFTKAADTDNGVRIYATDTLGRYINHRLIAIDNNGKLHPWKGQTGSVRHGELRQSIATFPDLKLNQIKEFQFQTRSYEWVEFNNIALQSTNNDLQVDTVTKKTSAASLGPVDFQGYFPDSKDGTTALKELWADKDKDLKSADHIITTARNGLRNHTGNANILRWVGNLFVWGKSPQNPKAVELMYHASGSPNRGIYGDAVYFGLSVTKNKTPEIIDALADVAMKTDDYYNVTGRILWGCRGKEKELIASLDRHLNSADPAIRQKALDVKSYFTDSKAFMIKLAEEKTQSIRDQYESKLPEYKKAMLTGDSDTRKATLEEINQNSIMSIVDESFLAAFEACTKDENAGVREKAAKMLGGKFVWKGGQQNKKAIDILIPLLNDPSREVQGTAIYFGLSTVNNPQRPLLEKTLANILDYREINYYGRVIWGARRNKQACIEILTDWMNGSDKSRAVKAYEIYEDVTGKQLTDKYANKFANQKSDAHYGLIGVCYSIAPLSASKVQQLFTETLTRANLDDKITGLYILKHRDTVTPIFTCKTLTDRNDIRKALKDYFQTFGYMNGKIGPTGSGWKISPDNYDRFFKHAKVQFGSAAEKTDSSIEPYLGTWEAIDMQGKHIDQMVSYILQINPDKTMSIKGTDSKGVVHNDQVKCSFKNGQLVIINGSENVNISITDGLLTLIGSDTKIVLKKKTPQHSTNSIEPYLGIWDAVDMKGKGSDDVKTVTVEINSDQTMSIEITDNQGIFKAIKHPWSYKDGKLIVNDDAAATLSKGVLTISGDGTTITLKKKKLDSATNSIEQFHGTWTLLDVKGEGADDIVSLNLTITSDGNITIEGTDKKGKNRSETVKYSFKNGRLFIDDDQGLITLNGDKLTVNAGNKTITLKKNASQPANNAIEPYIGTWTLIKATGKSANEIVSLSVTINPDMNMLLESTNNEGQFHSNTMTCVFKNGRLAIEDEEGEDEDVTISLNDNLLTIEGEGIKAVLKKKVPTTPASTFTPVAMHIIKPDANSRKGTLIDVDTSRTFTMPDDLLEEKDAQKIVSWTTATGADFSVKLIGQTCYVGHINSTSVQVSNDLWQSEDISAVKNNDQLRNRDTGYGNITKSIDQLPRTYIFKTSRNTYGIMHLIAVPQGIKIRYKLLAQTESSNNVESTKPTYHTVQPGESLASIAKQYYGNQDKWETIKKANSTLKPDALKVGTRLLIPETSKPDCIGTWELIEIQGPEADEVATSNLIFNDDGTAVFNTETTTGKSDTNSFQYSIQGSRIKLQGHDDIIITIDEGILYLTADSTTGSFKKADQQSKMLAVKTATAAAPDLASYCIGTWELIDIKGSEADEIASANLTFKTNGQVIFNAEMTNGHSDTDENRYEIKEGRIVLIDHEDIKINIVDGKLTLTESGTTGTFKKQAPQPAKDARLFKLPINPFAHAKAYLDALKATDHTTASLLCKPNTKEANASIELTKSFDFSNVTVGQAFSSADVAIAVTTEFKAPDGTTAQLGITMDPAVGGYWQINDFDFLPKGKAVEFVQKFKNSFTNAKPIDPPSPPATYKSKINKAVPAKTAAAPVSEIPQYVRQKIIDAVNEFWATQNDGDFKEMKKLLYYENETHRKKINEIAEHNLKISPKIGSLHILDVKQYPDDRYQVLTLQQFSNEYMPLKIPVIVENNEYKIGLFSQKQLEAMEVAKRMSPAEIGHKAMQKQLTQWEDADDHELEILVNSLIDNERDNLRAINFAEENGLVLMPHLNRQAVMERLKIYQDTPPQKLREKTLKELEKIAEK